MPVKGRKNMRGKPDMYDEVKKQRVLALTDSGTDKLDALAKSYQLSRSDFVEKIARGEIPVPEPQKLNDLKLQAEQKGRSVSDLNNEAIALFLKA